MGSEVAGALVTVVGRYRPHMPRVLEGSQSGPSWQHLEAMAH